MGFAGDVLKLFEKERATLIAAGLDAAKMLATMERLLNQVAEANATQELLKRQLKAATGTYTALKREMYAAVSGYLDMAIAAVDKRSDAARNIRRLRSRIRRISDETVVAQVPAKPTREPSPEMTG